MREGIGSYAEFWPIYLRAHSRPSNQRLHALGTGLGLVLLCAAALTADWRLIPAAIVVGYGFAWAGHFFVEGNKPATFGHPLWSLVSDFRMFGLTLTGRLAGELHKYGVSECK
jgi:hypothetical protein